MNALWWDSPSVRQFRDIAAEFIALVDDRARHSAAQLLHAAHPLLVRLYLAGLALPVKPDSEFREIDEDSYVLPETDPVALERHQVRWRPIYKSIHEQLGSRWNYYQEIFDPYGDPPEGAVTGSLADDLAGIYMDVNSGLELWASGAEAEAVWTWRCDFESHWSEHVTGALRAIRTLSASYDLSFPTPEPLDA